MATYLEMKKRKEEEKKNASSSSSAKTSGSSNKSNGLTTVKSVSTTTTSNSSGSRNTGLVGLSYSEMKARKKDEKKKIASNQTGTQKKVTDSLLGWEASLRTGGISDETARKLAINASAKKATDTEMSLDDIERNLMQSKTTSDQLKKRYERANEALRVMLSNGNQATMYSDFYQGYQPSDYYKENEAIYKQNLGEYADLEQLNRAIQNADRAVERYESEKKKYGYNENLAKKYSDFQKSDMFETMAKIGSENSPKLKSTGEIYNMSDADVAAVYINADDKTRANIKNVYKLPDELQNYDYLDGLQKKTFLSAVRMVSSAYLRLLIFLRAILVPACASSSPAFLIMYSV